MLHRLTFRLLAIALALVMRPATAAAGLAEGYGPGCFEENCFCTCPTMSVQAEYLMWWTRGRNLPALVTTSPDGTPRDDAGVLGLDDTRVLFGDESVGDSFRSGGRVTLSHEIDECGCWSVEGRVWGLEDGGVTYFNASDGDQILGRPFFNVLLDREDAQLVAFPGVTTDGRIRINIHNDLFGADAAARLLWHDAGDARLYFLGGYQFTRLDDSLAIRNVQTSIDPQSAIPVGTILDVADNFRTQNEFHGGQFGFLATAASGCWTVDLAGRVALGNMRERAVIQGRTLVTVPDSPTIELDSGLLAQPTNSGQFERDRLAFIPQLDLKLGYQVGPGCQIQFGYSLLYWSNVLLAADQIDRRINPSQNPGPIIGEELPEFRFRRSDFWAMGLSLGVECRF